MEIVYGTLGYMLITFPYALIWHMGVFRQQYEDWNYLGKNPSPPIGLLSMVFQGAILSYFYKQLNIDPLSLQAGVQYSLLMGVFFWSCHVVAAMAKHDELRDLKFFVMETLYLTGQFAFFGVMISYLHRIL